MRYVASEWSPGDIAIVTGDSTRPTVRMLVVRRRGDLADRRLWWGVNPDGRCGYHREESITDIQPVVVLTAEELNQRQEVNP